MDAQSHLKEDIKRETVYCLDDDNETEVQADDTISGETACLITDTHTLTDASLFQIMFKPELLYYK